MRGWARGTAVGLGHLVGRATGRYYFEDFVRVYPGGIAYNRLGRRRAASPVDEGNFRNHLLFYDFASQFAPDAVAVDVGCGSGYGSDLLREAGAREVHGCDLSKSALAFAEQHFGERCTFTRQNVVHLDEYGSDFADVAVCSEVLEHVAEYGLEDAAVGELRRIVRPGGVVVTGTPNVEILPNHGFDFEAIEALFTRHFGPSFCIFENLLLPPAARLDRWHERERSGHTGLRVAAEIPDDAYLRHLLAGEPPRAKEGDVSGDVRVGDLTIDTRRLRNFISWIVVAVK